ncbi:metal-dependent hydrolase family protein [Archaeoglobus neptunius]|uniref:metal-dependent hydrolase family protein n=1 Tax=Archaeoglobus neptunius TaxID=2798580 RepID=UPI0019275777|nr:amidohydrolase family protein [Archaeoglobus neptunius]
MLVLDGGKVIDPAGDRVIGRGRIIIDSGKIVDAGSVSEVDVPDSSSVIDTGGLTIMPGLIDAHMHITGFRSGDYVRESLLTPFGVFVARAIKDLEAMLDAGYTTVVDAGSIVALHLRDAVEEGVVRGPRILASGYPLSQTFGHGDIHFLPPEMADPRTSPVKIPFQSLLCDGEDEFRKGARYALREGADFLKIFVTGGVASQKDKPEYPQMTRREIAAVVEEARRAGRFVHAHAESSEGYINAVEEGVRTLAHGMDLNQDAVNVSLERDVTLIPTLSIVDVTLKFGPSINLPDWMLEKLQEVHERHIESVKKAYREGVRLAAGTDFFIGAKDVQLYGLNSLEIKLLVNLGVKPMDALKAATINAAVSAGLDRITGSLETGKVADIIVVDGDPTENPEILVNQNNIKMVIKEGKIVKQM